MDQDELTIEIARAFIEQEAPQELFLYPGISDAYRKNRAKILDQQTGKDEPLGFVVDVGVAASTFLAPLVLQVVGSVISNYAQKGADPLAKKLLRRLKKKANVIPPLTPEQLVEVREQIVAQAREHQEVNFTDPQAKLLAEIVVGKLATIHAENEQKPSTEQGQKQ